MKSAVREFLFVVILTLILFFLLYCIFDKDISSSLLSTIGFFVVFGSYPFIKRKIDSMSK